MKNFHKIILVLSITILPQFILSQESNKDSNKLFLIKKTDGGEFIGEIISDDGREVLILTKTIGKVYIRKDWLVDRR